MFGLIIVGLLILFGLVCLIVVGSINYINYRDMLRGGEIDPIRSWRILTFLRPTHPRS